MAVLSPSWTSLFRKCISVGSINVSITWQSFYLYHFRTINHVQVWVWMIKYHLHSKSIYIYCIFIRIAKMHHCNYKIKSSNVMLFAFVYLFHLLANHIDGLNRPALTPLLTQWSYCSLALSHRYIQPILQTDTTHTVVVTSPGLRQYRSY